MLTHSITAALASGVPLDLVAKLFKTVSRRLNPTTNRRIKTSQLE
jgi:hypothetical protein